MNERLVLVIERNKLLTDWPNHREQLWTLRRIQKTNKQKQPKALENEQKQRDFERETKNSYLSILGKQREEHEETPDTSSEEGILEM